MEAAAECAGACAALRASREQVVSALRPKPSIYFENRSFDKKQIIIIRIQIYYQEYLRMEAAAACAGASCVAGKSGAGGLRDAAKTLYLFRKLKF